MTNEELQQHIKAIEGAVRDGKVQRIFPTADNWLDVSPGEMVRLSYPRFRYRIKPEPGEMVLACTSPDNSWPQTYQDVTGCEDAYTNIKVIRVREVIDQ